MSEVGTLKELDVKPGDVVQYANLRGYCDSEYFPSHMQFTISECGRIKDAVGRWWSIFDPCHEFRIISRATQPAKLWRDMTDAEKGALLLAKHDGMVIECWGGNGWWSPCAIDGKNQAYRIRPEPKVETVTISGGQSKLSGNFFFGPKDCDEDTHRITFTTIDGKPDTASIKMEAI